MRKPSGTFAALLAFVLMCLLLAPAAVFAEERSVTVDNHTSAQSQKTIVSDIRIGDVDAPEAGKQLDSKAKVTTAEEQSWDIPVLWVRDDLTIMSGGAEAAQGRSYLPVLAFFVPDEYALQGSDYRVILSDELTALFGAVGLSNRQADTAEGYTDMKTATEIYATMFPRWFVEGSASAVQNAYRYQKNAFKLLCKNSVAEGDLSSDILYNYLYATSSGKPVYFDLAYTTGYDEQGNEIDDVAANYASGYLAVLYLSDLAYRSENGGDSAVSQNSISTEKLRSGLNQILAWLHDDNKTLDSVIAHISIDDGESLYKDTDTFAKLFIKGKLDDSGGDGTPMYPGDNSSLAFVASYLDCMAKAEAASGVRPSGSILFDFDEDSTIPLDFDKEDSSEFYKVVESNTYVDSSVRNDTGAIGGGKSFCSDNPWPGQASQEDDTAVADAEQEMDTGDDTVVVMEAPESADDLEGLPLAA